MFHLQAACANCIMQRLSGKIHIGSFSSAISGEAVFSVGSARERFNRRHYSRKHHASLSRSQLKKYCDILGVPVNASEGKIKQSFYKKSLLLHPDRNKGSDSTQQFNEVSEAYQALINYKKQSEQHHHQSSGTTWHKNKSESFKPWFQTHRKPPPPPPPSAHQKPTTEDDPDTKKFDTDHLDETSANFRHHSQASEWCNDNYRRQLAQAVENKRILRQQAKKREHEETCILMYNSPPNKAPD